MVKHTDSVCVFYHLLVRLIIVLQRIEETSTLFSVKKLAELVEGNTRNKPHLALQSSLVRDTLQEIIASFIWF